MGYFYRNKKATPEEDWIPLESFFNSYYQCRKRKRNTFKAVEFEYDYKTNIINLWREVNKEEYKIGRSITFLVTYPKLREIFAANFRDRVVHHVIMERLNPLFEADFIEDCYSCRDGKGTSYGVERLRKKIFECSEGYTKDCWIGKFDIKGFFMSIDKRILWGKLKKFIEEKYEGPDKRKLLYITESVTMHCPQKNCTRKNKKSAWKSLEKTKSLFGCDDYHGLPIGNLTSQCFANFYMSEFDHLMSKLFDGMYGRYVDDFYVISRDKKKITKNIDFIRTWLKENLGLTLHPKKLYIQHYRRGVTFIGVTVKVDKVRINSRVVGSFFKAIHRFNMAPTTMEEANRFIQRANSYLGFLLHYSPLEYRKRLCEMMDKKWIGMVGYDKKTYAKFFIEKGYKPL